MSDPVWLKLPASFVDDDLRAFQTFGELKMELAIRAQAVFGSKKSPPLNVVAGMSRGNAWRSLQKLLAKGRIEPGESGQYQLKECCAGATAAAALVVAPAQQAGCAGATSIEEKCCAGATTLDREYLYTPADRGTGKNPQTGKPLDQGIIHDFGNSSPTLGSSGTTIPIPSAKAGNSARTSKPSSTA